MKFNKRKTQKVMEGDLTPMIDMTFQLIAFFMLLINFSKVERTEDLQLPTSVLAIPPEDVPDYQIVLNQEANGNILFHGQRIAGSDDMGPIFTQEINNAARQGVGNPGDISVVIRASEDTPTGIVQKLIAKCQDDELQNFKLRVKNTPN